MPVLQRFGDAYNYIRCRALDSITGLTGTGSNCRSTK